VNTQFYEAVLPSQGPYCAFGKKGNTAITTFHDSVEELVAQGSLLAQQKINAYFTPATFDREAGRRQAIHATTLRCLFLDLDVGKPKNSYADKASASAALQTFISDHALPLPTIVNSGKGLHVYWPFVEEMPAGRWKRLADAWKQLCMRSDLVIDPAVPADAARVLRMPDTLNFNSDPPLPVQIICTGEPTPVATFEALLKSEEVDLTQAKTYGMDALTLEISQKDFPPSTFSRIARKSLSGEGCKQIAQALTDAATLEEPLWRAALSIAWRCTDAETAIHKLSSAHPEYDPALTLQKAQATKGPMTCKWYRDNYSAACEGCPQKITSPIQLGAKILEAEALNGAYVILEAPSPRSTEPAAADTVKVDIPAYPFPYFRGVNGGVFRRTQDAKGNIGEEEVYKYDLYVTNRQYDTDAQGDGEGDRVTVHLHTPKDGVRRFSAPVSQILVMERMRDLLLKHGVVAIGKDLVNIMGYLVSSIRNLQKLYVADLTRNQMGWTPDLSGFVIGELEYKRDAIRLAPAASATRTLAPLLVSKGSLEEWSKIANFYARPGMEVHALALFFGFAAPLLRLYGGIEVRGALINLMSNQSGTGKTTVQTVINSIWGNPSELLLKQEDKMLARMQWMGLMNHLPVTMDEVTNIEDEAASSLVYDIPQGRGRHRMESQSNKLRTNTTSWQTFVISSSNSSLYDKMMRLKRVADGELRRIIELHISRPISVSKAESDAIFVKLSGNFGLAGPRFIQYVMNNREEVDEVVKKFRARLDLDLQLDQSDRFHAMSLALALAAGYIARKIGLHCIDIQAIYDIATLNMRKIKTEVIAPVTDNTVTALETLAEYINENLPNALVINNIRVNSLPNPALHTPRGPLRLRFEPDTKEVWIAANQLRDYFTARQIDFKSALRELVTAGVMKNNGATAPKRLAAGALAGFDSSALRAYCFSADHLGIGADQFVSGDASLFPAG